MKIVSEGYCSPYVEIELSAEPGKDYCVAIGSDLDMPMHVDLTTAELTKLHRVLTEILYPSGLLGGGGE